MKKEAQPFYRKIPGFRSGDRRKMALSGILYLLLAGQLAYGFQSGNIGFRDLLMVLGLAGLAWGNLRFIQDIRKSEKPLKDALKRVGIVTALSVLLFLLGAGM
ncbi:hypothetical protein [Anaerotalea alkaliphila]|uniref:Uncharacterized protein n=1 Tax=Anaerotalea alkaliphila TaxID=2662126 RepID=A0A7X5KMH9_9FIRM|nr:hypothetical protein [Anaerotalea alkaliphila]NDL67849.1 hypothetical protein [Anaerotalea alkaliphila]